MNGQLHNAYKVPPVLKSEGRGKVLIKQGLIDYQTQCFRELDEALARIPDALTRYNLEEFNNETLQRAIISEGSSAVEDAVLKRTLDKLEKSGLFPAPKVRREWALKTLEELLTKQVKNDFNDLSGAVNGCYKSLIGPCPALDSLLVFRGGKLRVHPRFIAEIEPRFTLAVDEKHLKHVKKIREAASMVAELDAMSRKAAEEMEPRPLAGIAYDAADLVTRLARGAVFEDAELVAMVMGVRFGSM